VAETAAVARENAIAARVLLTYGAGGGCGGGGGGNVLLGSRTAIEKAKHPPPRM